MNYNPRKTATKSAITVALLILFGLGPALEAAEVPKLDPGKPIQFDIQLGAVQTDPGTKLPRTNQPIILGGYLEGGKLTGAYAPCMDAVYAAGPSSDEIVWDFCPYGPRHGFESNYNLHIRIREATASFAGGKFEGTWTVGLGSGDPTQTPADQPEWKLRITAQPAAIGYTGTFAGTFDKIQVRGPCVVVARNVAAGMIDPANAVYQIATAQHRVLVEVRAGKAVQAAAVVNGVGGRNWHYRRPDAPAAATRLLQADATGMTLTIVDEGLWGKAVTLAGAVSVGSDTIKLDGTVINGAGKLRDRAKDSPIEAVRNYPLADPRMARCLALLKETHRGAKPIPGNVLEQATRESLRDDVQPAPGEATRYSHRLWRSNSFIYAPWFDFWPVPGAVRYRFEVNTVNVHNQLVQPPVARFEAESPRASLAPIWAKVPVTDSPRSFLSLSVTAVDANGQPVGKPQTRGSRRRAPFAPEMIVAPEPGGLMELALRQPYHLVERQFGSLYLTRAVRAANAGVKPLDYSPSHWHYPHQLLAEQEKDPGRRAELLALLDTFNRQRLLDAGGEYKTPYHYNAVLSGVVQETGRNFLNALDIQPDAEALDRMLLWTKYFGRLQQPSGSWCIFRRNELGFTGGFSLWGSRFLENTSAPWLPFFARLRQLDGNPDARALARAMEERAVSWFRNNTLRTGFGELLHQQTDPSDMAHCAVNQIEYVLYVLRHAPPSQRDLVMASDLMRRIEDLFITWDALPLTAGGNGTMLGSLLAVEALCYLEYHALTGDPLMLAKSEALAASYLQRADPWTGSAGMFYNRFKQETDDPDWIVRWVKRYRELKADPPAAIPERHLTLTLDRLFEGADRLVLDLAIRDGRVTQALARTPTQDGPGMNFHQPGRLHTRAGKPLFHVANAADLRLTATGLAGTLKLGDTSIAVDVKREHLRGWRGTWKAGTAQGRVEGVTVADVEINGPQQIFIQINEALSGGEAWQTWALAGAVLPASTATFLNPNAGWTAQPRLIDCALKDDSFTMTLEADATWHGVAEVQYSDGKGTGVYTTTPDSPQALLANWEIEGKAFNLEFGLNPQAGDWDPAKPVAYTTTWKAITPGKYRVACTGQRLGNLLYGTAEVTGPDGTKTTRQFLGDVEAVKTTATTKP